jgi:serine/threonine protein kinase/tetratricopeptide (TPR) repeat protein
MIGKTLKNYRILEKLGAGGQGTVYKAIDTKLGRNVVIKVLPPELTAKEANLKRFEREARLASSLDHPNICTIYDLDDIDGVRYIAMQYVTGRNVRQLVAGRPLELRSALTIAIQVTDALAAAHASGIIHRDIKANNVMVTDVGQVKVLDFGLAKLLDDETAAGKGIHHTELTEVGVPYGTATYAAPEQARGDRVDKRADIFSTGVLLYEMLAGTWPFRGKNSVDVRHAVLHGVPAPIAEKRGEPIPQRLQEILDRSMAKEPADRYQKVEEFRDDLRKVLQAVTGAVDPSVIESSAPSSPRHLSGSGPVSRAVRWLRNFRAAEFHTSSPFKTTQVSDETHQTAATSTGDRDKKTLAILPFRNMSNDPASNFYEFSLADAAITELARVRSLVVRPSSLIARYQGKNKDPREIGRELGVGAVLSAGFITSGGRFRVTAQLLDVRSGDILWSDRIDAPADDILAVQDTIAQRIVDGLRIELGSEEQVEMTRGGTRNAAAYEEYLRGRDCFGRFIFRTLAPDDCESAIKHFERAAELDPSFALAHDGIGACYANRVIKGYGGGGDYARAEAAFNRALALDPEITEARMLMVFVYLWHGDKEKARKEVETVRNEAPNEPVVYFVKAVLHRLDGEYDSALRSLERLERLDPAAHVVASYNRALILNYMGEPERAMTEIDRTATTEPEAPLLKTARALTLYYLGDFAAGAELIRQILGRHPTMSGVRPILAMCRGASGEHDEALAELTEPVRQNAGADADVAYWLASAYALLDHPEEALDWLGRAIALGNENYEWFAIDPSLASICDHPRFQTVMRKPAAKN